MGDVSLESFGSIAMPGAAVAMSCSFASPIRTRDCRLLPRTMGTVTEALEAIQGLPVGVLKSNPWQTAVKVLTSAATAKADRVELANVAAAEVRAALLLRGWLE